MECEGGGSRCILRSHGLFIWKSNSNLTLPVNKHPYNPMMHAVDRPSTGLQSALFKFSEHKNTLQHFNFHNLDDLFMHRLGDASPWKYSNIRCGAASTPWSLSTNRWKPVSIFTSIIYFAQNRWGCDTSDPCQKQLSYYIELRTILLPMAHFTQSIKGPDPNVASL